jgi:hypothetical protein
MMVQSWTRKIVMGDEDEEYVEEYEKSGVQLA